MAWIIDTCLVIDIAAADPVFARSSATCLADKAPEGLVLCPVSYVELAPVWNGDAKAQDSALTEMGIIFNMDWLVEDTRRAHAAWHRHVLAKRSGHAGKRPIADIMIGAFASRFQGLLTRNPSDFRGSFPSLTIATP